MRKGGRLSTFFSTIEAKSEKEKSRELYSISFQYLTNNSRSLTAILGKGRKTSVRKAQQGGRQKRCWRR